ncbi:hypothetical protein GCM10009541_07130 [Micromonospora gifhornensis]|uniref:HEAT repeat-containing protein n=2 Tax=Micromonospora gifhornensis TaxID=84594 RepID=A0ABQ4IDX0_9ACTN|nr:hypothetical protein Vgi01_27100 [Micromonospora gifhornensis]
MAVDLTTVVWHGDRMIDSQGALEAVVRHATELDDDYDVIAPTVTALAACGDITLVPRLEEVLEQFLDEGNDQDGLQTDIIELLEADPSASRRVVRDFATADSPELRRTGLWALGFVLDAQDVELLVTATTDDDPGIRSMAVGSIPDAVGDDRAFDALVRALRDEDEQVRVSAVSRLGFTGRIDAVTPLVALAADPTPRVRSMIAYALGRLGSHVATPTLLRLLHDPVGAEPVGWAVARCRGVRAAATHSQSRRHLGPCRAGRRGA